MRWHSSALVAVLLLQDCASPPPHLDNGGGDYALEQGPNEIDGEAAILSSGGYRHVCEDVALLPVTPFWTAWVHQTFGSQNYAVRIALRNMPNVTLGAARQTDCDGNGHFRFDQVADGKYYVFSAVFWLLRWQQNGGGFIEEVEIHHGRKVVISMIKDWRLP